MGVHNLMGGPFWGSILHWGRRSKMGLQNGGPKYGGPKWGSIIGVHNGSP
jgi:hypothetical protein